MTDADLSARASDKRREIIEIAYRRFYEGGFHATGIDTVMADSGISKRTLYKYFPSKEDLIEAVLDHYGDGVEEGLFAPALARSPDPREQIIAIFEVRREMMQVKDWLGCLAVKAAQEYSGKHAGIEARGRFAGQLIEDRFAQLCVAAGFAEPKEKAMRLNILFQGAVLLAQTRRDDSIFDAAIAQAHEILSRDILKTPAA